MVSESAAPTPGTALAAPLPRELAVIESAPRRLSLLSRSLLALVLGLLLGAAATLLALSAIPPRSLLASTGADVTESDMLEREALFEYATSSLALSLASRTEASSTSEMALRIPVVVYHSVRPHREGESAAQDRYDVTPELLEEELVLLKERGYVTVDFYDVDAHWKRGAPLPERPIILSFDDGWKNQIEYAYPILKRHDAKAVFFVYTNPIDRKNPQWMSWDDIVRLDREGFEIAGHTRTHPLLSRSSDAELAREIAGGKRALEDALGHTILSFAYPFGVYDERIVLSVADAGYSFARTIRPGVWNDPLHRLEFHGTLASDRLSDFSALLDRP